MSSKEGIWREAELIALCMPDAAKAATGDPTAAIDKATALAQAVWNYAASTVVFQ